MDLPEHDEGEIAIPITSAYVGNNGDHGHNNIHGVITPLSNGPPPTPTTADDHHHLHLQTTNSSSYGGGAKKGTGAKYRECLKNHAAAIGGNATDGCGEFMPSGEEGTLEALKCSACGCHRNFHRKETDGDADSCFRHPLRGRKTTVVTQKSLLISAPDAGGGGAAFCYAVPSSSLIPRAIMPLGAAAAMQTSESDEMEGGHHQAVTAARPMVVRKRFRTKFTAEQKEKMLGFAERVGWRLQRQEEGVVQQFCQEIGVKRRVLKVWMHNNKHSLAAKKNSLHLQ